MVIYDEAEGQGKRKNAVYRIYHIELPVTREEFLFLKGLAPLAFGWLWAVRKTEISKLSVVVAFILVYKYFVSWTGLSYLNTK